jgi:hypothetical protein
LLLAMFAAFETADLQVGTEEIRAHTNRSAD